MASLNTIDKNNSKALIVLGMHRSGTSFTANWLHECGLNMGDNLMGGGLGNEKGHYEDWDFVQFHNDALRINNLFYFVLEKDNIQLNEYLLKRANHIIQLKNELHEQWGWKDPRTCLFIDLWHREIPHAKYLIVYRDYLTCVDSLIRRDVKIKLKSIKIPLKYLFFRRYFFKKVEAAMLNNPIKINKFIETWYVHNKKILDSIKKIDGKNYIVLSNNQITQKSGQVFDVLINDWGFNLNYFPVEDLYDNSLMSDKAKFNAKLIDSNLKLRCEELLKQFEQISL